MSSGPAFGRRRWILALKKASCNSWTQKNQEENPGKTEWRKDWSIYRSGERNKTTNLRQKERTKRAKQNKQTKITTKRNKETKTERKKERRKEANETKHNKKTKKTQYWDTVPLLFRFVFFVDMIAKPSCPHQSPNLAINKTPQLQIAHANCLW